MTLPTVVSAIYGDSDTIKPLPDGARGILYTDRADLGPFFPFPHPSGWQLHYEPMTHLGSSRLRAKFWKVLGHLACPDPLTLWIDGSMQLLPGWESMVEELGDNDDALFFKHHHRDCIYEEVPASLVGRPESYRNQALPQQVEHYRDHAFPGHAGLIAAGCMLRRNAPEVREFNIRWWQEICRWSLQDQLSAAYLLFGGGLPELRWHYFSKWMTDQPWFDLHMHTGGDTGEAGYYSTGQGEPTA